MSTRWWSQPFAPEGSAAAEGIVKQLGRPLLDPLTVLVREAAQNSWDARANDGQVDFRIRVTTLGSRTAAWRDLILPGPKGAAELPLDSLIAQDAVLLVVSDRGTRGLGGPLRAGTRPADNEKADFVQFLRNVGEPNDNEFGGGTYGFGKGIFYRLSRTSAILVDTLTSQGDRRLMGAALGNSWYDDDQRYTGRHWWGETAADSIPDPYVGSVAHDLAGRLGLPGFDDGATGTDVALIAADLGTSDGAGESRPRTVQEAGLFLASSMLWHLWPKAVEVDSVPPMRFSVEIDGEVLEVPDPRSVSELRPFVESLEKVRAGAAYAYRRTVAPKDAGRLALTVAAATTSRSVDDVIEMAKPYEGPAHHIARMRVAELVVDYLPTNAHPDELLRYGGVFRSTLESDEFFASSEPPTHDSWVEKGLSGTARGVVQGARNFVVKTVDSDLGLGEGATGGQAKGLGALSSRLASLLPSVAATGPGARTSRSSGGSGGSGRAAPRIVEGPNLLRHGGKLHLVAKVHVPPLPSDRTVRAEVAVVVEGGGRESAPPAGAAVPSVTGWRTQDDRGVDGPEVVVRSGDSPDWWVFATYVPDAVVRFRITEGAADGS
ncbi:hypothetical protein [Kribbella sp. VKM Ac-2566]|uniref:hypothetical protein n=1 Tax=Kribbella sp. VKM Ac-2566 TaxID=2512218 RepID=UPI001063F080|nr:hypothetical protein [Kribbella sp. VKM Ac-2566]TDW79314.1 hypothetical protein EV647_8114 [Kribbella sp. VKM Ac-2566]